jgi:cellulose biosynthesis protein BcsQ
MKTIAFFNSKSGVGKTTLVYHLAWMYADLGLNVVVQRLAQNFLVTSNHSCLI